MEHQQKQAILLYFFSIKTGFLRLHFVTKPHVVADAALCRDKPQIPNKSDVERFNRYSVWNEDQTSISCTADSKPVRSKNFEPLNLVCDRKKASDSFKWFHMSPNGKLRP